MMHEFPCHVVRARLEAFHDGEVPFSERLTIQGHLEDCVSCSLANEELIELTASLQQMVAETETSSEPLHLSERVVERLGVEEQFSLVSRVSSLFQDMHLVWAGIGASVATMHLPDRIGQRVARRQPGTTRVAGGADLVARQPRLQRQPGSPRCRHAVAAARHRLRHRDGRRRRGVCPRGLGVARRPRAGRLGDRSAVRRHEPGRQRDVERSLSRAVCARAGAHRQYGGGEHGVAGHEHDREGPARR